MQLIFFIVIITHSYAGSKLWSLLDQ
uniref:Uncharacterized protein n=1 Tax=Anguilla anguilla TaxID=7936 RepID=A0A0E9VPM6_ANGAN